MKYIETTSMVGSEIMELLRWMIAHPISKGTPAAWTAIIRDACLQRGHGADLIHLIPNKPSRTGDMFHFITAWILMEVAADYREHFHDALPMAFYNDTSECYNWTIQCIRNIAKTIVVDIRNHVDITNYTPKA